MAQPDLHPFEVEEILVLDRRPPPAGELRDIRMVTQVLEATVASSTAHPGPAFHDRVAAAIAAELGQRPQHRMAVAVAGPAASQRLFSTARGWVRGHWASGGAPLVRAHAFGIALVVAISSTALAAFGTGTLRLPERDSNQVDTAPSSLDSPPASWRAGPTASPSAAPSPIRSHELVAPPAPTQSPMPWRMPHTHEPSAESTDRPTTTDTPTTSDGAHGTEEPDGTDTPEGADTSQETSDPGETDQPDETDQPETSGRTGGSDERSGSEVPAGGSGSESDGADATATPER